MGKLKEALVFLSPLFEIILLRFRVSTAVIATLGLSGNVVTELQEL